MNLQNNELFNEYHLAMNTYEELNNREFYEWQDAEYESNQQDIVDVWEYICTLKEEALSRGLDLSWPSKGVSDS